MGLDSARMKAETPEISVFENESEPHEIYV
jgi:hypothetical protein